MAPDILVRTLPRRPATLSRTLNSIRQSGFGSGFVYRGRGRPKADWLYSAAALLGTGCDPCVMAEDDILMAGGVFLALAGMVWPPGVGCLSLYTPDRYADYAQSPAFPAPSQLTIWGACALVFPRAVLEKLAHHVYLNVDDEYAADDVDTAIGAAVLDLGYSFWYVYPSVVQHVGENATGWRQASSFIGEDAVWTGLHGQWA